MVLPQARHRSPPYSTLMLTVFPIRSMLRRVSRRDAPTLFETQIKQVGRSKITETIGPKSAAPCKRITLPSIRARC